MRVLDPARAELYAELGMRTVCPTSGAIDVLSETVLSPHGGDLMYILIAGGGKVGRNLAHELLKMRHEVTVIEQSRRTATACSRRSSSTSPSTATRPSSWCSSAAASSAPSSSWR